MQFQTALFVSWHHLPCVPVSASSAICIQLGGKLRSAMFLQATLFGASLAGVIGPLMARPFLSTHLLNTTANQNYHIYKSIKAKAPGIYGHT